MSQYDPQGGYNNPYPPNSGGGAYGGQPYGTPPPNSGTPYGAPPSTGDPYGGGGFHIPPSGPPPKKKRGGAIVMIVVVVLVLGCLGGIGYGVYRYISWVNQLGTTAANALASPSGSTPASPAATPSKKRTGEGDGATVAVGQCVTVREEGIDDNYVDISPTCGKGTYKVVARFDHTTLTSKCQKTGADTTYKYDSSRILSSYVLCLKEQK